VNSLAQRVEHFWWRTTPPPAWLRPLSSVYQWINARNLHRRFQRAIIPSLPVIFVGNITVGGSGKTPFVLALVQALQQRGREPVIVCRGDGGCLQQPQVVTADANPKIAGDEACMMAQASSVSVIAGRDRVAGSVLAASMGDVMVLDDGLQYRQLARVKGRSCEIVLLPSVGVGNGALLPIGPLREPLSALNRADIVVVSGEETGELPLDDSACFHWSCPVTGVWDSMGQRSKLLPCRIHLVTAIARSNRVVDSLLQLGFEVVTHTQFADHYQYRTQDVSLLCEVAEPVVTTMKDAVKLHRLWPDGRALWVCQQQLEITNTLMERVLASIGGEKCVG